MQLSLLQTLSKGFWANCRTINAKTFRAARDHPYIWARDKSENKSQMMIPEDFAYILKIYISQMLLNAF